jgi:hypothetical protein
LLVIAPRSSNKKVEKVPEAPSYYFSKKDDISSITKVVGKRDFQSLTSPAKSSEKDETQAGEESTQSEPDSKAADTNEVVVYKYINIEDVSADLKSYTEYLEGKKFINVTDKANKTTDSSNEEDSKDTEEYYQYSGPSTSSDHYLSITLESNADSYSITTTEGEEPWNTYFQELWNKQKEKIEEFEKQPKATNTISQAENTVRAQGQKKLGLPEKADSYEYIAAPGLSQIDGKEYYTVRTYKRLADETLIYIATYLYDYKTSKVSYAFDEVSRKYTPLS